MNENTINFNINDLSVGNAHDNFSVLKLNDTFNIFLNHSKDMCTELKSILGKTSLASRLVASEDSGLSASWDNVGEAMNNFSNKLYDLILEMQVQIQKYVDETIVNEVSTSSSVESISRDIDNISSQLDSII